MIEVEDLPYRFRFFFFLAVSSIRWLKLVGWIRACDSTAWRNTLIHVSIMF